MTVQHVDIDADDVRHIAFLIERELERKGVSVGLGLLGAGLVAGRLGSPSQLTPNEEADFVNELSHFVTSYFTGGQS